MAEHTSLDSVSRETTEQLEIYAELLRKWAPRINLVAKSTLDTIWDRHFLDSIQVFRWSDCRKGSWVDLGTGAGFPGLVVAIMAVEEAPDLKVTLVESDRRKMVFCQTVARELGLDVSTRAERAESIEPLKADVVSARALAPLPRLLEFAERHLMSGGHALFPKGAGFATEVEEALASWNFAVEKCASVTEPTAVLLKIKEITRV
ncbi:MAG: 16S rRNA (guanine(527)-N(7))-methyltransferase RsmG [Pseudomonadota bacterium]